MILSVAQDTDIHLVDGTGWVQKSGVKYPILIDTTTTQSGRRYLAEGQRRKLDAELRRLGKRPGVMETHTFTWDELVSLHASVRGEDEMRRLSSGGDALSDLYMFFGGVVESEVRACEKRNASLFMALLTPRLPFVAGPLLKHGAHHLMRRLRHLRLERRRGSQARRSLPQQVGHCRRPHRRRHDLVHGLV